jgi:hypothetical protein
MCGVKTDMSYEESRQYLERGRMQKLLPLNAIKSNEDNEKNANKIFKLILKLGALSLVTGWICKLSYMAYNPTFRDFHRERSAKATQVLDRILGKPPEAPRLDIEVLKIRQDALNLREAVKKPPK